MTIEFVDQRPAHDWSITASQAGDVLTINGTALDFSGMADGDVYPLIALDPEIFATDVTRSGGAVNAILIRPVDAAGVALAGLESEKPVAITIDVGTNIIPAATAAATALAAARAGMSLSFSQLLIGLVAEGWITEAEGDAWSAGSALPASALALVATLPAGSRFAARTRMLRMSEALRLDPLVIALGAAEGKTEAELDTFFTTYAEV
ncbi:hypothetical protein QO034_06620 [Sedimentitalea sp. JM2-8]|uniref:Uncharacterized protein n=1 Tax=Sedimentitalea xiamensis TaxID=3050037 RepID=A0ABT7FCD7_9RHOB|nr:hypothetical protein [Sedimentitalea xiamensis]MDK3072778.1 hypothetical protein [Sedimentitalea xiamensis]